MLHGGLTIRRTLYARVEANDGGTVCEKRYLYISDALSRQRKEPTRDEKKKKQDTESLCFLKAVVPLRHDGLLPPLPPM